MTLVEFPIVWQDKPQKVLINPAFIKAVEPNFADPKTTFIIMVGDDGGPYEINQPFYEVAQALVRVDK